MLYNGIVLPPTWPPTDIDEASAETLAVPYLEHPPDVVSIDLVRQLFVDDFLITSTSFERTYHKPAIHPASPVLVPETDEEMDNGLCPMAAPFNDGVCYDPQAKHYKLWYMPGWFHRTALATSEDGIHWTRPTFDIVPETNIVWGESGENADDRDGCLVWLDHDAQDAAERFKMFQYYRRSDRSELGFGGLQTSADGIHWGHPVITPRVGDNTSFFYNPFRKKWCMSIRHRSERGGNLRARWYQERDRFLEAWSSKEEVFWQRRNRLDLTDPARPDHRVALYDVNVAPYESLMVGAFAIFRGPENDICAEEGVPKTIDLELGYSRDGFHFSRPDRLPFIGSSRRIGDWNRAYIHACGGLFTVIDDELRFYFAGFSGQSPTLGPTDEGSGRSQRLMYAGASTGLATLRRDGLASIDAGDAPGELLTRPVQFSGSRLFVNVDCQETGELHAEICDTDGISLPGLEQDRSVPVRDDTTKAEIVWTDESLATGSNREVRLRFRGRNCSLYSFWITDDPDGKSGGPGFTRGRDI